MVIRSITENFWEKALDSDFLYPSLAADTVKLSDMGSLKQSIDGMSHEDFYSEEKPFVPKHVLRAVARHATWMAIGVLTTVSSVPYHLYQGHKSGKRKEHAWALLKDLTTGGLTVLTLYSAQYFKKICKKGFINLTEFKKLPQKHRFLAAYFVAGTAYTGKVSWDPLHSTTWLQDNEEGDLSRISLVFKRCFGIVSIDGKRLSYSQCEDLLSSFNDEPDPATLSGQIHLLHKNIQEDIMKHLDELRQIGRPENIPYPPTPKKLKTLLENLKIWYPSKVVDWEKKFLRKYRALEILTQRLMTPIESRRNGKYTPFQEYEFTESEMRAKFTKRDKVDTTNPATKRLKQSLISYIRDLPDINISPGKNFHDEASGFDKRVRSVKNRLNPNSEYHTISDTDPFTLLDISSNSNAKEVNRKFTQLARYVHPDKLGETDYAKKLFQILGTTRSAAKKNSNDLIQFFKLRLSTRYSSYDYIQK